MFGNRRRRAVSNPPVNSNVNASAATAAAQAFLSSQASNTSLSSAAAAAALRSRPTTPTSVADIQTKRTIRRNGSTSSAGSSVGGSVRGPPGSTLVRRGSSGSMTERTFRESSPVPSAYDAPPVPAIPQNITKAGGKKSRRSASMDAPGLRIASPPPNKTGGRGSSLGPSATASRGSGPRNPSLSSVSEMNGESRGSVNFSYPTSTRPMSPEQRRLTCSPSLSTSPRIVSPHNQNLVYDPNTRRFLPLADILAIEQRLNGIANAPVKKKKRNPPAQGTHLAAGSVGGRIQGTAVDAMETASNTSTTQQSISQPSQQPIPQPFQQPQKSLAVTSPPKKKKKRVVIADSDSDQASILPNSSADESDVPSYGYKTRAGAILAKKPSVVREDREREEKEDDSPLRSGNVGFLKDRIEPTRTISPSPLPRSSAGRGHGRAQSSANYAQERQHTRSASQPPMTSVAAPPLNEESPRGGRVQSVSPARTPHFMATPETLTIRHQPPPRSVSPRKSALKHSSMSSIEPRGPSPSDGGSFRLSEVSNDEEQPRKKGNRVSFDEGNNVVLGQSTTLASDSPMVPSPQVKRSWFNIGRGKKKDIHATDEDDDEVMKPRPALPSFGSVRERKTHRETEERVLVRPPEQVTTIAPVTSPTSPLFTSHTGGVLESPMGQSNDHVAGSLLAHDATSKNAANISKSREPLPPDVTSLEGTGEISDASSTYSLDNNAIGIARSNSVRVGPEDGHADTYRELASPTKDQFEDQELNEDIPEIAVQMPTPTPEGTQSREWLDMPGGYRGSGSSTSSYVDRSKDEVHAATENGIISTAISPTSEEANSTNGTSNLSEFGDSARTSSEAHPAPIFEESEESENDSIYSDAAEEFEAPDDGGFMSLDAVVESPVSASAILASEPDSPRTKLAKERAYMSSQLQRKSSEPDPEEGWEKAQQYWKNLSVDRKKQLELDAFKVTDEEEKEEVTPAPKPKKTKKKSVTIQSPTSPIMQTMQQSPFPQVQKQSNTERSYMIQPGSKVGSNGHSQTTMRSSMRAEPPHAESDVHIRQSMRGPGSTKGATQNGTAQPNGILQKKQRPVSLPPAKTQANTQAVNQHLRLIQGAAATATSPNSQRNSAVVAPTPLRRKSSGDSDTSFKRARPATDGISMRRSMRRESDVSSNGRQQSPLNSSRFSLRSSSPGGPPAVTMRGTMRSSLRGSNDSTARAKSPIRIPGFGRSSSARPAPKQKSTQRSSRFADSSDEDEPRAGFRSRFVDSSDDDEPTPIAPIVARPISSRGTPVRSIPKPIGYQDGDSSDLPDSDDESRPATAKSVNKPKANGNRPSSRNMTAASGDLQRSGSGRGTIKVGNGQITPITPPRPQNARRGSILSIFRKKQDPNSKVRKYNGESPARRDTHLERSKEDLEAIKRPETLGKPDSPRVLKKNPRQNSGSWPLADDTGIKVPFEEGRPFSADTGAGIVGGENKEIVAELNGRPEVGNRRFTATGLSDVDVMGQGGSPRKKKKFQVLRKMFRLED
ncbi:uncharacterized protein Bfra_002074 [Botrytis fragariae]|uniref:Uncharacterized protein n=1 Tax=Botrytis fragariae TaxID=1964551 RepID=A0A8H6B269_9HELO|nr:uncharacterized protein Bfra_002074 [Botrytis fragariae]KAF5877707.1 hypothetical protein Bfra_002074 [Botrytis fragariae]